MGLGLLPDMVAGLNRSVAHSITDPKLGDRCKNIFGSALTTSAWHTSLCHVASPIRQQLPIRLFSCDRALARIIHQPEKSTGEGDFVVQMNPKTTVSQAYDAPKTISSGLPDTTHSGRMGATGHPASCQPPGASRGCLARTPLGLSIDLTGPARAGARRPIRSNSA